MTNSLYSNSSRYVHGGNSEVSSDGNKIEWWDRAIFRQDPSDIVYVVEEFYSGRMDLIAAVFYNEPKMWWFIAQFNNILDPFTEITTGRVLIIPTKERMQLMLNGTKGGYQSQRELAPVISPVVV